MLLSHSVIRFLLGKQSSNIDSQEQSLSIQDDVNVQLLCSRSRISDAQKLQVINAIPFIEKE